MLVADDNPTNREVVGKILERGGHAVTLVNDGEQALDAIERDAFDVVLLDRNMPGMGGIEALQALRLMTARPRAAAGDHAVGRRHAGGEARGARGGRRRLPLQADRGAAPARRDPGARGGREQQAQRRRAAPSRRAAAAPRAGDGAPRVVNTETLGHLEELGSSPAFVEKLIGVFLADNAALLERIEQALAGRNFGEFRSLLHAMKGSSASMGTDRLTRLCTQLGKLSDAELRLQAPALLRSRSARSSPRRAASSSATCRSGKQSSG